MPLNGWPEILQKEYQDLPPHGRVLCLTPLERPEDLEPDAIEKALREYMHQLTPFVGILIDLANGAYTFSDGDLTVVTIVMAPRELPCAIVLSETSATELQRVLHLTTLDQLEALRVVETRASGIAHIRTFLQRTPGQP